MQFLREIWWRVLLVALAAGLFGYVLATVLGGRESANTQDPFLGAKADQLIALNKAGADPAIVRVSVGSILEFASHDGNYHDMAGDTSEVMASMTDHSSHDAHATHRYTSGIFGPEEAYRVRMDHAGSYLFADTIHPETIIHVDVYERSK